MRPEPLALPTSPVVLSSRAELLLRNISCLKRTFILLPPSTEFFSVAKVIRSVALFDELIQPTRRGFEVARRTGGCGSESSTFLSRNSAVTVGSARRRCRCPNSPASVDSVSRNYSHTLIFLLVYHGCVVVRVPVDGLCRVASGLAGFNGTIQMTRSIVCNSLEFTRYKCKIAPSSLWCIIRDALSVI